MHQAQNAGLRERKKQKTRAQLTETAIRLFAERGFSDTTIDDIVAAADISRRSFFRYFPTKEDAVISWLEGKGEGILALLKARPRNEPPLESLSAVFAAGAAIPEAQPAVFLATIRILMANPSIRARYIERERGMETRIIREISSRLGMDAKRDLLPRVVTGMAFAAKQAALETWLAEGRTRGLAEVTREAFTLLEAAVTRGAVRSRGGSAAGIDRGTPAR